MEKYRSVIIGAVTDSEANPMLMVFSLVPYFDFSMSREEEASGRSELIEELGSWETYTEISKTKKEMRWSLGEDDVD